MNVASYLIEAVVLFSLVMALYAVAQALIPAVKALPVTMAPVLAAGVALLFVTHSVAVHLRTKTLIEQGAGLVVGNVQSLLGGGGAAATAPQVQGQQQAANQQAQAAAANPEMQIRGQVLRLFETVLADPENVNTEELRGRIDDQIKGVVKTAEDRKAYRREILAAYECQKEFLQDALTSLRSKKGLKSKARSECETRSGAFFFREKLVMPEQAAANDNVILQLAKGEKIPNPAKNNAPWDEDGLRSAVYLQQKRIDAVRVILR